MPKTPVTWIVIADGARARVFAHHGAGTGLASALDHEFVASHLPSRAIGSDEPGRAFDSAGQGRHAMEPPTDPHRYEKQRFAHAVAALLDDARKRGDFERLVVVAPPQALGDLRAELSEGVRQRVVAELAKDLTRLPEHALPEHLREVVAL